jgi:hypothetical protein
MHCKKEKKKKTMLIYLASRLVRNPLVTWFQLQCFLARHPKIVAFGACKGIKAKA